MLKSITRSERVIIVEDDRVRSVVIGPRQKLRPAFVIAGALALTAAAAAGWMMTAGELGRSRDMTGFVQAGADTLATRLEEANKRVALLTGELEAARKAVEDARAADHAALAKVEAALSALDKAGQPDTAVRGLRQAMAQARAQLAEVARAGGNPALGVVAQTLDDLATSVVPATSRPVDIASNPGATEPVTADTHAAATGLVKALAASEARTAETQAQLAQIKAERDRLAAHAASVEARSAQVTEAQIALMTRLREHADLRIGELESSLRATGINLENVLAEFESARFGQGGPMIAVTDLPTQALPKPATEAMTQLEVRLARQARLKALASQLPMTAPVDDFYISSGFGKRRDPFTNALAFHAGLDLVAQYRSPVTATAPGKVVDVGWDDGYGRMVEVDHGFGIRTRYGHLEKAVVKEGQQIGFGEEIGTLGSSGRSSGPHVHYEVLIDGKPVDPLRFMEKGRHVCQG